MSEDNRGEDDLRAQLAALQGIVAQLQVHNPNVTVPAKSQISIPAPERFSFDKEDWEQWIVHYERYCNATGLKQASETVQINNLLLHMGPQVSRLLITLQTTEDELKKYSEVKTLFDTYFIKKKNIIYERAKFNVRTQMEGETAKEYIANIIALSKTCNYGGLTDELIRDRLVVGIRDPKLSETLQLDENLSLEKAIDKITQSEAVREQNKELREASASTSKVERVTKEQKDYKSKYKPTKKKENSTECNRCAARPSHAFKYCPAIKEKCTRCKIRGHYAIKCRTRFTKTIENNESSSESSSSSSDITEICNIMSICKPWTITANILEKEIHFKIDSGADETVITFETYKKIQEYEMKRTKTKLMGPGQGSKRELEVAGVVKAPITWNGRTKKVKMYVVNTTENLLGRPALEKLEILKWKDNGREKAVNRIQENEPGATHLVTKDEIIKTYPELFKGLGKLENFEYNIKITSNAEPFAVETPRRVPMPLIETIRKEIKRMVEKGVIEPIEEATPWCSPMVAIHKPNGKVRICTDYTQLNKYVIRERYQLPTVEEAMSKLQEAQVFSKLDCSSGFWQVQLSKESRLLTTFITPFGRYVYNRLPFGISSGPEVFQRTLRNIFDKNGLEKVLIHADDILITGKSVQDHNANLEKVLEVLRAHNLTINVEKCEIGVETIRYLGQILSKEGISPDSDNVKAILEYPSPTNKTEVRRFLGMFTYLTKFVQNASHKTEPIRQLLHEQNEFMWTANHEQAFQQLKQDITKAPVLAPFNPNLRTRINADASAYGLGGLLEQLQHSQIWRPVFYCSKTLSEAERRYAQIEKEALAITWVCERLQQYIIGNEFIIRTDHKPLLRILGDKPINELTMRLQRFRMRLMKFDYVMEHVPGKEFNTPDALSRAPLPEGTKDQDIIAGKEERMFINTLIREAAHIRQYNEEEIVRVQEKDPIVKLLKEYTIHGWPDKDRCKDEIIQFYKYKADLSIQENVLTYNDRIVIPEGWRKKCIKDLHAGHFGIVRSKMRAKSTIWWPNINSQLENTINNCEVCLKHTKPTIEPMLSLEIPSLPWKTVGVDLFEIKGTNYLVIQDYYSKFPEFTQLVDLKSKTVIKYLKECFARWGIPETVRSDNGRQFDSFEFRKFAEEYNFKWISSSPKYPQSNGLAESGVKLMKNILKKNEDPHLGLLAYRNTPLECGASPAQLLMGRNLRETLPVTNIYLQPKLPNHEGVKEHMKREKVKQAAQYNRAHRAKPLQEIKEGARVWIVNESKEGTTIKQCEEPRSYWVQAGEEVIRRNRRHLQPLPERDEDNQERQEEIYETPAIHNNKRSVKKPSYLQDYVC